MIDSMMTGGSGVSHPVIARLLPVLNDNGKRGVDRDGRITLGQLDERMLPAMVNWYDAWSTCAGLARSSKRTGTGPLYLRLDEHDFIIGIAWRRSADAPDDPLELPFELADRVAARAAALDAMEKWGGAPYGGVEQLMLFLGKNYWVPGIMAWALGVLSPQSYMTPLASL